ncbi:HNH endonuclease [Neisseria gonorrhoeae]
MRRRSLAAITEPELWRKNGDYESGASNWQDIRKKILERDEYVCQECGFHCNSYLEVHHIDGDHTNNAESNLETLCTYCHGTQHLGFTGISGRGRLIWLPELEGRELINVCRWLYLNGYFAENFSNAGASRSSVRQEESPLIYKPVKNKLHLFFEARIRQAIHELKTTEMSDIAMLMGLLPSDKKQLLLEKLSYCRVFPVFENYSEDIVTAWKNALDEKIGSDEDARLFFNKYIDSTEITTVFKREMSDK